jgi:hypothetical protein
VFERVRLSAEQAFVCDSGHTRNIPLTRALLVKIAPMRLLAFSDLHRDLGQAERLVERSAEADAVVASGDIA